MLWDMYQVLDRANPHIERKSSFDLAKPFISQLREGVKKLAEGGEEGAQEIR